MAQRERDERRIISRHVAVILRALHIVEQKSSAPLPAPFVVHVGIQTERSDVFGEFVATGRGAVGIGEIAIVAVERLRAPGETLELIIPERDVTQFEVHARESALFFGQCADAVGLQQRAAAVFGFGIDETRDA